MGLALSLSLCLLVIQVVFSMYSSDRFHRKKDRIYRIITTQVEKNRTLDLATAPLPLAEELKYFPEVEKIVRVKRGIGGDVSFRGKTLRAFGYFVDKEFFDVFSFELEVGDPDSALIQPKSLVLSKQAAEKFFGSQNPIDKTITINKYGDFKVTGILKDYSRENSHFQYEFLGSMSSLPSLESQNIVSPSMNNWKNLNANYVYLLLRKGSETKRIIENFSSIIQKNYGESETQYSFHLQTLTKISPGQPLANDLSAPIPPIITLIFSSIALIILFIACFNYTSLSLAKSLSRAKEIGIRKVVGANRLNVFTQFLGEAIIVSLIALVIAFCLRQFLLIGFKNTLGRYMELNYQESLKIYLAFVLFTILTGFFAGFFPALYLSKFNPVHILKDIAKVKVFSRINLRRILLSIQFCISFILIITTIVLFKQINFQKKLDPGFQTQNILNVELGEVKYELYRQEIVSFYGIQNISASSLIPNTGVTWPIEINRPNLPETIQADAIWVDENFLDLLEIDMIAGQNFSKKAGTAGKKHAVLNETAVKRLGFNSPVEALGQSINLGNKEHSKIIGVVKDFIYQHSANQIGALLLKIEPDFFRYANIKVNPQSLEQTKTYIEEKWSKLDPFHPFQCHLYDDQIEAYYAGSENLLKGIGFISFLAIFISVFGLMGMVIHEAETKTKEIGIRKIIGATRRNIILVLSKGFLRVLIASALAAAPIAWIINTLILSGFAYRIILGLGPFVLGYGLVFSIGLLIIFTQAVKTSNRDPVEALRYE